MAASWGMLIKGLEQSEKDSATIDDAKRNKAMNCSCSRGHSAVDNPKGANTKKEVIHSAEKPPFAFDSLFVFKADTKKEFIPAKHTYPFFDKQAKGDAIDPAELIPLFSKQNLGFKQ